MRLERLRTLPPPRLGGLPTSPEYKGKFGAADRLFTSAFLPSPLPSDVFVKPSRRGRRSGAPTQHFLIRPCGSPEGVMGALMVIFSLQPKQRAKTKGRLTFFT